MAYFPFFVDLSHKKGLIVGGGKVASGKIERLKAFDPELTVIAPEFCSEISDDKNLNLICRNYKEGDEDGAFFVIAATDNRDVNKVISSRCQEKKIPVNVVDDPELCSFLFPSIVKEGKLTVGISTSGSSPTAAIEIKKKVREMIPSSFDEILDYLYEERNNIKKNVNSERERHEILKRLFWEAMKKGRGLSAEETLALMNCNEPLFNGGKGTEKETVALMDGNKP